MKTEPKKVIAREELLFLPFNYRDLFVPVITETKNETREIFKSAPLAILQNENARLETFYKNISRF